MCDTGYSLKHLVSDLRRLGSRGLGDTAMAEAVPEFTQRMLLMKHNWLRPHMCIPHPTDRNRAGIHTLHEEPDHSLAIFVVTWLPGDETPPHDHGTWAVIAGLEGHETNHWWRRLDDGSIPGFANVERSGRQRVGAGTMVSMPGDAIHSLHNDSGDKSVTLHLYGVNVDFTNRCKFDPANHTVAPYRFGDTTAALASPQEAP